MKHTILQDSSFIIASVNPKDIFHNDAIAVLDLLLKLKNKIKLLIPSVVFFESIFKLIQRGVEPAIVQQHLWNYLYKEEVINFSLLETMAFKMSKQLLATKLELKTSDLIIALTGIEFESQILTFDKAMFKNLRGVGYSEVYLCSDKREGQRFINDLDKFLGH